MRSIDYNALTRGNYFGGGLAKSRELMINPISDALDQRLTFQRKPELKIAHYESTAGTVGCAMAAFDLINEAQ